MSCSTRLPHQCPRADYRLLREIFDRPMLGVLENILYIRTQCMRTYPAPNTNVVV